MDLENSVPPQFLGDLGDLARGDPLNDHLHECQHQSLFTGLIAQEELSRKRSAANAGHSEGQAPHPSGESMRLGAASVTLALLRSLIRSRLKLLGDLDRF